jgi:HSP20 family protein
MASRREIERLQTELDELFEDLWRGPRFAGQRTGFRPHVDIWATGEPAQLTIVVELAGVDPAELSLVVSGDVLIVSGVRRLGPGREQATSWYQVEVDRGHFERRVRLPANAGAHAARASYARGLLTIEVPLAQAEAREGPVAIPVSAG